MLALSKIFLLALKLLKQKLGLLKQAYKYIDACTRWWTVIFALVETNIAKLSFNCAIQILVSGYSTFFDKFNFVAMLFFMFLVIVHALINYPMIYAYTGRKVASTILVRSYYSLGSFYMESFCVLLRSVVRAFVTGIFLQFYSAQILALVITDFVFILVSCLFFRQLMNKVLFVAFIGYQITLLVMDMLFLMNNRNFLWLSSEKYDILIFNVMLSVFIAAGLASIVLLFTTLYQLVTKRKIFYKENK